jgi:penicillin-binding protein 1C
MRLDWISISVRKFVCLTRIALLQTLIFTLLALFALAIIADQLFPPPLEQFLRSRSAQVVTARDGSVLRAFADQRGIWRYPIETDQVSPNYLQLLLNYEDRRFYRHPGVDPMALLRASAQALYYRRAISGGSTLSMQVARIIEPIDRSLLGKLKQALRALQLERRLSKSELLAIYLKHAPFGGNIEGVQTASMAYLGKSAAQLTDAEAALLVVLPQRPSRLRPDRHALAAQTARDKVLRRMASLGVYSDARVADALLEPVIARRLRNPMLAPLLAERMVQQSSAALVPTSIDPNRQRMAESLAANAARRFPASNSIAILMVENHSMLVRAYVGSSQFAARESFGHIDMVRATRSPGSTLKPSLYALALDEGLIHSESLLIDAPQEFGGFRPGNFAESFNGPVSAAQALRLSLNITAVDLLSRLGPGKFYARLQNAGLKLQMPLGAEPNLSLILGGAGSNLESIVAVHAALARGGLASRVRFDAATPLENRRLMSEGAAWMIYQMLADANNAGESELFQATQRRKIAYKTGTSFGFRDAWAIGSSPNFTIGVWIGRPDGTPNPGSFGAISALPLLFEAFAALPVEEFGEAINQPVSVTEADICWPLGLEYDANQAELCHRKHRAWVLEQTIPPTLPSSGLALWQSDVQTVLVDAKSGLRRNASCLHADVSERRYARWPALLYPWLSKATLQKATPPMLAADCAPDAQNASAQLVIEGLLQDSLVRAASNRARSDTTIGVRALGSSERIRWLLDGVVIGQSAAGEQFIMALPAPGKHRLLALDREGRYASIDFEAG